MQTTVDFAGDVIQNINEILTRCLDEIREKYKGDIVVGLRDARQQIAHAQESGVKQAGGNERVSAAVLEIFDAYCEELLRMPGDELRGDRAYAYISGVFSSSDFFAGLRKLCNVYAASVRTLDS